MNQAPPRTLLMMVSIAGTLLFLVLFVLLIRSTISTYPDLEIDDSYADDSTAPEPSGQMAGRSGAPDAAAARKPVSYGRTVMPERSDLAAGEGKRLEQLVELSVGNRVNRAVSFGVFDNTLQKVQTRSAGTPQLAADIGYVREQLARLSRRLEKGEVSEQQLKRFMLTGLRAGRDRRITRQEFSVLMAAARTELGMELEAAETDRVLVSLQQPEHRREIKEALQEETAVVVKEVLKNPVSRRLAVFGAEQAFLLYEDKIYKKLPPGIGSREAKTMFYTMLDKVVKQKIPDSELTALSGILVGAVADRQITRAEIEKMTAILKKYLPTPALKNIIKSIDAGR